MNETMTKPKLGVGGTFAAAFHRHLDGCQECDPPTKLCKDGDLLIRCTGVGLAFDREKEERKRTA